MGKRIDIKLNSSEARLLASAIILQALMDMYPVGVMNSDKIKEQEDAIYFFKTSKLFELLGLNPEYVKRGFLKSEYYKNRYLGKVNTRKNKY